MRKYILNPETLMYEIKDASLKSKLFKGLMLLVGSIALAVLYLWFFTSVLGLDLPKTAFLKAEKARWDAKLDVLNTRLESSSNILSYIWFSLLRTRSESVFTSRAHIR